MADFWVSQQRHWCKYCKKYIANNKPSLDIHNNGQQHKNNVERFLRGVYKDGQQKKEDDEEKFRELQRIEKAAMMSMGKGAPSGYQGSHAAATSSSTTATAATRTTSRPISRPSTTFAPPPPEAYVPDDTQPPPNPYNLQGRDEWAVRTDTASPGEWQTVAPKIVKEKSVESATDKEKKKMTTTTHDAAPEFQDDEDDDEDLANFKIQEKQLPVLTAGDQEGEASEAPVFRKRKVQQGKRKKMRTKE